MRRLCLYFFWNIQGRASKLVNIARIFVACGLGSRFTLPDSWRIITNKDPFNSWADYEQSQKNPRVAIRLSMRCWHGFGISDWLGMVSTFKARFVKLPYWRISVIGRHWKQAVFPLEDSTVIYIDTEWFAGPLYRFASRCFPHSEHPRFLIASLDIFLFTTGLQFDKQGNY